MFRLAVPLVILAIFFLFLGKIDLSQLASAFSRISYGHLCLGLLIVQIQVVLSALRWRFTAARLNLEIGARRAVCEYYVASFLNQCLPGGIAGDAVRAWRSRRMDRDGHWKPAAKAVLFERLSGQAAFLPLAFAAALLWPLLIDPNEPDGILEMLLAILTVVLLLIALAVLAIRFGAAAFLRRLGPELEAVFVSRGAFAVQSALSAAIVATYVAVFALASDAVGAPLSWQATLAVIPLCLLAMLVPFGLGGWGTREAAAMALWPLIGFTAADGLAASLLYGLMSWIGASPGVAVLAWTAIKDRKR